MSKFAPHRHSGNNPRPTSSTICQKCLGTGHFTYECKSTRPYVSRPSRTAQLENPRLLAKLKADGEPSVEVPEEFKTKSGTADRILEAKEKQREKYDKARAKKRTKRSSSAASSSSESNPSSDSGADSGSETSSSGSDSGSSSHSSRSRERDTKRRRPRARSLSSRSHGSERERSRSPRR
jgi:hypothetical protein